jgi:uncharacterized protein (DUF427 family)
MARQRIEPSPGQESVWDYPRPLRLEDAKRRIKMVFGGVTLAYTTRAKRVLETNHPPVCYVPPEDIRMEHLRPSEGSSFCKWKGRLLRRNRRREGGAAGRMVLSRSRPEYRGLGDHVAFYPSKMDACWVEGEKIQAQEGDFYGGWITSEKVAPFKGGPGTRGW